LAVVEGELNALSLAEAYPDRSFDIASPGSCNDFGRHIETYRNYETVVVVCDLDAPGVANGWCLKESLTKLGVRCILICVPVDYNDILQHSGPEAVRAAFEKELV
jgi:hypothetical protein